MKKYIYLLIYLLYGVVFAQSNTNPDISLIGTMNAATNFNNGSSERGKLVFGDPEMEMFVEGYLNPFAKAAANIAYEDNTIGVEELYAQVLSGLPFDIQLKAGKFLAGFGKLNTVHPHAWPFLNRPLFHQIYLGQEGLNEVGVNLSYMLPTESFYSGIDIGIFKGESVVKANAAEADFEDASAKRGNSPIVISRLNAFFQIGDFSNLEAGLSFSGGLNTKHYINIWGDSTANGPQTNLNFTYYGIDFKYKYKPDDYTSLVIQGEALINNRDVIRQSGPGFNMPTEFKESISTWGAFIYADYRFDRQFSLGAKYDFTYGIIGDNPGPGALGNDDKNKTTGYEIWFGYYPVEETLALRLGAQRLVFNLAGGQSKDPETAIKLQMQFSLGPHKAHPF